MTLRSKVGHTRGSKIRIVPADCEGLDGYVEVSVRPPNGIGGEDGERGEKRQQDGENGQSSAVVESVW
jgi:hypothetical protein